MSVKLDPVELLEKAIKHIEELEAKLTCMCGDSMDHSPWEGHSSVSMFDHAVEEEIKRRMKNTFTVFQINEALRRCIRGPGAVYQIHELAAQRFRKELGI